MRSQASIPLYFNSPYCDCEELATLHDAALQGLEERAAHYAVTNWRTGPMAPPVYSVPQRTTVYHSVPVYRQNSGALESPSSHRGNDIPVDDKD